jgi:choline dehydrogenase
MKYDYIIIGAGSAGCVLANRLSANPANSVLLLEAGKPDTKLEIKIPAAYGQLNYSDVDWGFYTEPQSHVDNRKMYQPRGKTLGGCGSTNAMAYVRGHAADYDYWAKTGCKGWSYAELLPFFKKSEHNEQHSDDFHSKTGELNVTYAKEYRTPLADAFVAGCVENGIPATPDFNGKQQEGAGLLQFTIKNGQRCSPAAAFLKPILHRKNLTVRTQALVEQILIENERAIGVSFQTKKGIETAHCQKEVILSSGSFGSPQILMLSGIGAPDELKKHNIPVKKSLEGVGKNLHDHLMYGVSCLSNWHGTMNDILQPFNQVKHLIHFLIAKKGALTISPLEANAFVKTNPNLAQPDLQIMFAPAHVGNEKDNADIYKPSSYPNISGFTLLPTLLQPESRGYVTLRSANAADAPVIQPNYLHAEADRKLLLNSFKLIKNILFSEPFAKYRIGNLHYPTQHDTDAQIEAHIRRTLECVYHPVGTCKMGNDALSVVDEQLRVHGIAGLRVADGSIMPRICSGNTNAACIMIGEKAADMILKA